MPVLRLKKGRGWVGRREEEFFCNCQLEYKYSDTLSLPVPMYCSLQTAQELGVLFFYFYIDFFLCRQPHQSNPFRKKVCMIDLNLHFQNSKSPERL